MTEHPSRPRRLLQQVLPRQPPVSVEQRALPVRLLVLAGRRPVLELVSAVRAERRVRLLVQAVHVRARAVLRAELVERPRVAAPAAQAVADRELGS